MLWIIPQELHKVKLLAYVNALLTPFKIIHGELLAKRLIDLYKLSKNSQVCYLEAALRDGFDPFERRIFITDGNRFTRQYLYTTAEERPRFLGTMFLHNRNDYADTGVDFIVHMPIELEALVNIYALRSVVDFYRLDSKRYKVVYE